MALIPHQGSMCLLDRVVRWDAQGIVCESDRHRDRDHPLRRGARLPGISLVEPALQATALHGALVAECRQGVGMVTSLRDLELFVDDLIGLIGAVSVEATLLAAAANGRLYRFIVTLGERPLLRGEGLIALPRDAA